VYGDADKVSKSKDLYSVALSQFMSMLLTIKAQIRLNPDKAVESIDQIIILLKSKQDEFFALRNEVVKKKG
jgi:secreted protein with Ig-like and vWFA domain